MASTAGTCALMLGVLSDYRSPLNTQVERELNSPQFGSLDRPCKRLGRRDIRTVCRVQKLNGLMIESIAELPYDVDMAPARS
jgi:hypothetical protein